MISDDIPVNSFVSKADVIAHLRLYGAMRTYLFVLAERHVHFVDGILQSNDEGKLFFRRSIHRFKLWVKHVLEPKYQSHGCSNVGLDDNELPPFDVLLLLHAYMLHPRPYYEDTIRINHSLAVLNGFPLAQVSALFDESLCYTPSSEQVTFWETATGEIFSPPLSTTEFDKFDITCPGCKHTFSTGWLAASSDGSGSDLTVPCVNCGLVITDHVIGAAYIIKDIRQAATGTGVGLSGTILAAKGILDSKRSRKLTAEIASSVGLQGIDEINIDKVLTLIRDIPQSTLDQLSINFLKFYGFSGGFSFDVPAVALRQMLFGLKLYHLGWTNPKFPIERAATLEEFITRYGGFLQLLMGIESGSLSPTDEIDLVWHTHQLLPNYRTDSMRLLGWFMDHIDVEPGKSLETSFESNNTNDIWEKAYGTPYDDYLFSVQFPIAV